MASFSEPYELQERTSFKPQDATLATRSCGTCRDRRVLCDRTTPACLQCARSKKKCKGYGLRLSWPRAGDSRRAVVMKPPRQKIKTGARAISDASFVHLFPWDVELHYHLTASSPIRYFRSVLRIPMPFNPTIWETTDQADLFRYFQQVAFQSLTTFGEDPTRLSNILMRVASAGNTPSTTAVIRSLLALSSLHRNGLQEQAFQLKIASIKALATASTTHFGALEVIQHVAAGMLLCSFEVHQTSCTSSHWTQYITGIKGLLATHCCRTCYLDEELKVLGDWVYYHDVMARFTMRHRLGEAARISSNTSSSCYEIEAEVLPSRILLKSEFMCNFISDAPSPGSKILHLLSDVCDAVSTRPHNTTMSVQELDEYKSFFSHLERRIRNFQTASNPNETPCSALAVGVYQRAILIYLNRALGNLLGQSARIQKCIDELFTIFSQAQSCVRQFPLFILGCEARTDSQRTIILDLISRTEKKVSSRSLSQVKMLIQAMWAQDDLADQNLNYWDKVTIVISSCEIVPSLV
ncbi:hypothetical protein CC78DRAFT_494590 [Lojkania enalia]|uniref:Zn(2)-C6 fungal-type domain-containing protein n=1 Tax=Lojkania enalia TaxID=147567 RepID=A0A9P4K9Z1_9PLEO|nr:hypothetical protein CC78DRAFT_494590 [Didymosphaeria enalia]